MLQINLKFHLPVPCIPILSTLSKIEFPSRYFVLFSHTYTYSFRKYITLAGVGFLSFLPSFFLINWQHSYVLFASSFFSLNSFFILCMLLSIDPVQVFLIAVLSYNMADRRLFPFCSHCFYDQCFHEYSCEFKTKTFDSTNYLFFFFKIIYQLGFIKGLWFFQVMEWMSSAQRKWWYC